ncbi:MULTISPECIES: M3 family oligoendopeptidase [Bacillus]|uniref:Oligoendopeptidase n=1 Tax=Bacillus infantis NRRL B-14911 TaxID=1367477 RepID=U5LG75_9BACI|nr:MULTISPECIES: M3 family oligoendopeptidase [Bacillus]AGX05602.1 oligoendopeptidase [Bacillus infantis NRRL B-14911]EAR63615.1 YusX [Bacillus sp. NRRL B-14911]MCA1036314.1 M3 family oligoendopeptidase [Bacillus infantis]MCK6204891.1 M3 family oligoendopeptidase [Bacillus infantis]MCP1159869.1 M3 family oligoendopeptidase [Bacillus infantis]
MATALYSEVWDLDVFFEGGSSSGDFAVHIDQTKQLIDEFIALTEGWQPSSAEQDQQTLLNLIGKFEGTTKKLRQAGAFVSCLEAQNMADSKANELRAAVTVLSAGFQNALTDFDEKLAGFSDEDWKQLLQADGLSELEFVLTERRERAAEKLSKQEESLINALGIDGYHSWGQMYDVIVGKIRIPFSDKGQEQLLSVGQAANKFSSPERSVRKNVFKEWENAWDKEQDYLAKTLNHLAGFRLNVYKMRGWDDVLKEPLEINRMKKETLDAMWGVISKNKQPLVKFLNRKASLLGLEKLSWYDLDAPLGSTETKVPYQEGAEFILDHFSKFGGEMTSFSKMAFENKWIEAEDRPGKRPGGFHTYFPESSQSRIFMTYSGTPSNVSTLAHELGHGFHTYAMKDLHPLNRNYSMNVAETASTFAEMIVADAAVKNAATEEEKLALLEDKIQRSVALLMNIHARFLFETSFYNERKNGMVSGRRLNELMLNAQKEAYANALDEYHPSFWSSKLHFYITGVPFYNFPYTFGYLFSLGIYANALEEGKGYEEKYISLLKDTASMTVEDLAMKHLNADLTKPDFWEKAVKLCMDDVEEFLNLTEK